MTFQNGGQAVDTPSDLSGSVVRVVKGGGGQPDHSDGDHHVHGGEALHWQWVWDYDPLHP